MEDVEYLISVVIPVYNTRQYLLECVNSVLKQASDLIEVLIVDDGSTDGSGELCDEIKEKHNCVRVFHKKNGGLSEARNLGIDNAKGKYIMFLDSDDYWTDNSGVFSMLRVMEENPEIDFINFRMQSFYQQNNKLVEQRKFSMAERLINKSDAIRNLVKEGIFPVSACCKILRTSFVRNNKLYFQKDLLLEDILWFLNVLEKSSLFYLSNLAFYIYRKQVNNSITMSFSRKKNQDLFYIIHSYCEKLKANVDIEIANSIFSFLAYEYLILLAFWANDTTDIDFFNKLKRMRWLLRYNENPKVRKGELLVKVIGLKNASILLNKYMHWVILRN